MVDYLLAPFKLLKGLAESAILKQCETPGFKRTAHAIFLKRKEFVGKVGIFDFEAALHNGSLFCF